ncbi:MAG: type 1 glutamine amidotransferase [Candidatus Eiseniibacteriota bacterium]
MKTLCVVQHIEAEYLGLMEDHLESRSIRFHYVRPFVPGTLIPAGAEGYDGLVLLGAGPLGVVSGNLIPSLAAELRLARDFLEHDLPVIGIGVGAVLLAVAAGGGAEDAPLRFTVETATRTVADALAGHLPDKFPSCVFMRDRAVPPAGAETLATGAAGEPLVFRIGAHSLGFIGHPGIKSGMAEDVIMAFDEAPDDCAETLATLRAAQAEIAAALSEIMVGVVKLTGWMTSSH